MSRRFARAVLVGAVLSIGLAAPMEATDMTETKDLARQGIEMWAGDARIDRSIFAEGYVNWQEPRAHGLEEQIDLATWTRIVEANHAAFPDLKVEILAQLAEGDRVATHWRFSGTQTGTYLGRPATGRAVAWTGIQIDRIAEGKIAESWVVWDFFTMLRDLGVVAPQ